MWSHMDWWPTFAKLAGLEPPPREWKDNNGSPIIFDGIDLSESLLGTDPGKRDTFVFFNDQSFGGIRVKNYKALYTAKDTWLGPQQNLGAIGSAYNLTMDPFEKYDMIFNGAMSTRMPTQSPGKYAGQDNGWLMALIVPVVMEFNKSIVEFPSMKRVPGGASNDWRPDLQRPDNPVPLLDMKNPPRIKAGGG